MNILCIDASIRTDSRTKELANYLLKQLGDNTVKEVKLDKECIPSLKLETLEHRTNLANDMNFDDPIFYYAKEYVDADLIIIIAPFWDLSFPSTLKTYIEAINIPNFTFKYDEKGSPIGLCSANRLIYITTSGGKIETDKYGFGYIKDLAQKYHGIKDVDKIEAENLDIIDAKIDEELDKAKKQIDKLVKEII